MTRLCLAVLAAVLMGAGAALAAAPHPPPPGFPAVPTDPTKIPVMPTGKQVHCSPKLRGPKWVAGPGHGETKGWTIYGHNYAVTAWGVPCGQATTMVKSIFPKLPLRVAGVLRVGPKGWRCHGREAPGTISITNLHDGFCTHLNPSAMVGWDAAGPSHPGPYVTLP